MPETNRAAVIGVHAWNRTCYTILLRGPRGGLLTVLVWAHSAGEAETEAHQAYPGWTTETVTA